MGNHAGGKTLGILEFEKRITEIPGIILDSQKKDLVFKPSVVFEYLKEQEYVNDEMKKHSNSIFNNLYT